MKVFTPAPFLYFGKRCLVCLNVSEADTFESFQTKKQYKTNRNLNYNDKCLIYLLYYKICGLQYIGSTTDPFRYHYKDNNRKAEKRDEHIQTWADLFEHFTSHGHNLFLEDCAVTLIDKTDVVDPHRREEYWRRVTKTVTLCVEYCYLEVCFTHFSEARVLVT